ncbi:MAG: MBL fold metallo-hydrolase [Elusimicrobiota bacterium]|jgi:glyoxylase-like metal-dependent hydrolase (beta-lactamase superfamily II)
MSLYLKQLLLGPMENFVYLAGDPETHEAAVVDPAWDVPAILQQAKQDGYRITYILLTHGHFDHVNGVDELVVQTHATVVANTTREVIVGKIRIQAIPTPGHTKDSRCWWIDRRHGNEPILLTGDTLFVGTIGRCDLPDSNPRDMYESLTRLKKMDEATLLYPGHDYGAVPSRTLGEEKNKNPFLRARTLDDFLTMVRH